MMAVGDVGILLEARLVLDKGERLIGITDAVLTPLVDEAGKAMPVGRDTDAEGLALLPNGDRLVSFERNSRIWLYPTSGGPPRKVPSPRADFPPNTGMEALAAAPDVAPDAYLVGGEDTGNTWLCRVSSTCIRDQTVSKPRDFGLVSMTRLTGGMTAYLLRAYDSTRLNRIILKILRGTTVVSQMDLAPPLTVDNFEGVASVMNADGSRRFYLISDDNNRPSQRTLLLAFDWRPPDWAR
jgi:hypothetical protein